MLRKKDTGFQQLKLSGQSNLYFIYKGTNCNPSNEVTKFSMM